MPSMRVRPSGLARMWSLLLIVVLSMVTLTACKDANDPACSDSDDAPLLSVGDSGGPMCEPPEPDCEDCGGAWGDPHLSTFDGLVYDLQAVGEFTAADLGGAEVQVRFAPWGDSRTVSLVTGVAIATDQGDVSITIDAATSEIKVRIDGEERDLADSPVRLGDGLMGIAPGGDYVLAWPDGRLVAVTDHGGYVSLLVDAGPASASSGVLGDSDGVREDAFTTRQGNDLGIRLSDAQLYGEFAESWRITDEGSAFWYADGTSTETFTDRTFPDEVVSLASFSAEQRVAALAVCEETGVTEAAVLDACVFDVAATGDASFALAALLVQERTNAEDPESSIVPSVGEGTAWVTTLDGLSLLVPDRVHASDSTNLYVLAGDSEGRALVAAIDAATGTESWRVSGVVDACGVGVLDDDRIAVVGRSDGPLAVDGVASLAVLDAATGAVVALTAWVGDAGFSSYCSPMVVAGDVVAMTNSQGAIKAWDVSDEPTPAWELTDLERVSGSIAAVRDTVVVTSQADEGGRQAMLIDATTGAILDTHPLAGRDHAGTGAMVVSGDTVVVSLVYDVDEPTRLGTVTALTVSGGQLEPAWDFGVWNEAAGKDADHTFSRALGAFSAGEGLVIGHAGNELIAIDPASGAVKWRYVPGGFRWTDAPAAIADGVIWDGAFGGPLLSLVSTDGEFLGSNHLGD